ncbi:3-dehydroquinate synthase [Dyadobacter frigoris]|uniref:3-dehydroquinate synthase n=1 Tax=Dyadobacter frigoris TaxID=2576211 RepID=A0A4U6D6V5_9BACT|nr:3-dehydroquinate synthase [Dyadobacter frigoris]TKT92011.1 3-dehydroquinate synthase [Dyadobacter frigoris]GLU53110.1 3-dehydroquinate synthase [Dyadobacter frigoris]
MQTIKQSFKIEYNYSIFFTHNLFNDTNNLLSDFFSAYTEQGFQRKVLVVVDGGFLSFYSGLVDDIKNYFATQVKHIQLAKDVIVVPGGEASKNDPDLFEKLARAVDIYGIDRHSFVIGIGGGAVLDLVGYAAAVSHRGIKLIRIPTTVLSQNDSGVGVKNGINFHGKKNFLGTFAPPVAVFNDLTFLNTLDDRDWRSGISEAIKVALIKDATFFDWIEENVTALAERDEAVMSYLIHRCAEMHTEHIGSGDPFEFGSSRPLDFGHWAAHKLEYLTDFEVRHGEAVAIGIALDCVYANKIGMLSDADLDRIYNVLVKLGFDLYHIKLAENDKINLRNGLQEFREHLGGRLTIMLLEKIGKGVEVHEMDADIIAESVDILEKYISEKKVLTEG